MENSLSMFTPAPSDIKEGTLRKIYLNVPLDPDEIEARQVLNSYALSKNYEIPAWATGDQRLDLKFMDSMGRDPKKALEKVKEYDEWLQSLPVLESEVINYLQQGLIYITGRAKNFSPVLVINIRRIIDTKIDLNSLLRLSYFIMNYVIDNLLIPGVVETWTMIYDMEGVWTTEIPAKMLKKLSEKLSVVYCWRLHKTFVVNVPMTIGAIWNVVKHFLFEVTRKKIIIDRKKWREILNEFVTPENLEIKYGGLQQNKIRDFYPFIRV